MAEVKKRILTGDTPTGKLHLGHYVGTLENRVKLQNEYETFIISADVHALTTLQRSLNPLATADSVREVLLDNLAVGLDPEKVTFFIESAIPEIYEIAAIVSMYVTHSRALRNPTVKDEIKMKGLGDTYSLGFVNYPIYQVADILSVRASIVPVGVDQVAHLEQTRELAREINQVVNKYIFPVPEALVGRVGKLIGTDGNPKMSKSLDNCIYLSDSKSEIERRVSTMYTDPSRIHATDPGKVEENPVFIYLDTFAPEPEREQIVEYKQRYQEGKVGDVEVKKYLAKILNEFLEPIRSRRKEYANNINETLKILDRGNKRTQAEVKQTLDILIEALGITKYQLNEIKK